MMNGHAAKDMDVVNNVGLKLLGLHSLNKCFNNFAQLEEYSFVLFACHSHRVDGKLVIFCTHFVGGF